MSQSTTGWQPDTILPNNLILKDEKGLVIGLVDTSVGGFQASDGRTRYVGWKTFRRREGEAVHRHSGIVPVGGGTLSETIEIALGRADMDIRVQMPDLEWVNDA